MCSYVCSNVCRKHTSRENDVWAELNVCSNACSNVRSKVCGKHTSRENDVWAEFPC